MVNALSKPPKGALDLKGKKKKKQDSFTLPPDKGGKTDVGLPGPYKPPADYSPKAVVVGKPGGSSYESPTSPPMRIDPETRIGGGAGLGDYRPPPAYFDGGGQSGGATNPLASGSADRALETQDMDSILHGAKRKGRVRLQRGTE
jgi:hypothetical protein